MMETPLSEPEHQALEVAVMRGCCSPDWQHWVPAGHCLSRARLRHLRESEWVIVSADAVPVGFAAYKRADSDVRVIHEVLMDRRRAGRHAATVAKALLVALEMIAYDDHVQCLMFLLYGDVTIAPFQKHGYSPIVVDRCGTWLQKKLDGLGWASTHSQRPN